MDKQQIMDIAKGAYEKFVSDDLARLRAEIYSDTLRLTVGYDIPVDEAMSQCIRKVQTSGRYEFMPATYSNEDLDEVCGEIMLMMTSYFSQKDANLNQNQGGY